MKPNWTLGGLAGLGYLAVPGSAAAQFPHTEQEFRIDDCAECDGTAQELQGALDAISDGANTLNGAYWYLDGAVTHNANGDLRFQFRDTCLQGYTGCDNEYDDGCTYYATEQVIACNPAMLPGRANADMLMRMAMHEFGHTIGLEHSECEDSFMNHWVPLWQGDFAACDIEFLANWLNT